MAKLDKKQIIVGSLASLVMLVLGYLLWKHENAVSQAENAQTQAAEAEEANEVEQELESAQTSYSSGAEEPANYGDSNDSDTATGLSDDGSSSAGDSELDEIISALFGTGASTGTGSTGTGSGSSSGSGSSGSGSGTSNPPPTALPSTRPSAPIDLGNSSGWNGVHPIPVTGGSGSIKLPTSVS